MDSSPTSLFDSYEQDYQELIDSLRTKLEESEGTENAGQSAQLNASIILLILPQTNARPR